MPRTPILEAWINPFSWIPISTKAPKFVIFVTIPAFYTIAGIIDHARHTDDFDAVINAIEK